MVLLRNEGFLGNPFTTREDVERGCIARECSGAGVLQLVYIVF
jgi:hypothetical protein